MSTEQVVPVVTPEQSAMQRQLNTQVNEFESRNGLPICGSRPLRLGLDISDACNVRCIFCLAESGRGKRSDPDSFRRPEWLDHFEPLLPFVQMGIFSSYEALLNPWFDQFADRLHRYRTPFQVFTNGMALTPEMSEFALRRGMNSVWCSFHGARPKTHEGVMRGVSHDKVMEHLMALKILARRHNPDFRLTMVFCAMRRTIEELEEYVDLAHRVGAAEIQVNYLRVTKAAHGLDREAMIFHQDLYDLSVLRATLKANGLGIRLNHQPLFRQAGAGGGDAAGPCYRPWEHLIVKKNGDVTICCGGAGSIGNMFENDFFKVWNSKAFRVFRARVNSGNPPAACRKCSRGRENPKDTFIHLPYLRNLPEERRLAKMAELGLEPPARVADGCLSCAG